MMAVIITSSNLSIYLISCSCAELPITSTVCSLSVMVKQLRLFCYYLYRAEGDSTLWYVGTLQRYGRIIELNIQTLHYVTVKSSSQFFDEYLDLQRCCISVLVKIVVLEPLYDVPAYQQNNQDGLVKHQMLIGTILHHQ